MRRVLLLALAQAAVLGSLTAPSVVGLSLQVRALVGATAAPSVLATVIAAGSAAAMIANPVLGWLADRTPPRFGGRRVWLVGGALVGVAAVAGIAVAADPVTLTLTWVFAQAAYNACFGAINGLVSEDLAPENRTRAAGVLSAVATVGALPGLVVAALFPSDPVPMLLTVPAVAAVVVVIVALRVRERARPVAPARGRASRRALAPVLSLRFALTFGVRFVFAVELAAGLVFGLYLFIDRWALPESDTVRLIALTTVVSGAGLAVSASLIAATPLHRLPPDRLIGLAIGLLGASTLARALAPTVLVFQIAAVASGVAIGIGYTATRSIAQSLLPPSESALGLGVFNVANTLAPVVAPLLAGALVIRGIVPWQEDGYGGMYVLLTIPVVACFATLPWLRRSRPLETPSSDRDEPALTA